MERFVKHALFAILLPFFLNLAMSEEQEFVGPRLYETSEKITYSPISGKSAIALKDEDIPYDSASKDEKAKARKELLDDIEIMNAYMKSVAEEFANDGVVVVRAVKKTINVIDPSADNDINDRDNNEVTASATKLRGKLSPKMNFVRSAKVSPFKRAIQDKCAKEEAIFPRSDTVD